MLTARNIKVKILGNTRFLQFSQSATVNSEFPLFIVITQESEFLVFRQIMPVSRQSEQFSSLKCLSRDSCKVVNFN